MHHAKLSAAEEVKRLYRGEWHRQQGWRPHQPSRFQRVLLRRD